VSGLVANLALAILVALPLSPVLLLTCSPALFFRRGGEKIGAERFELSTS
jgi:hypothetical protein